MQDGAVWRQRDRSIVTVCWVQDDAVRMQRDRLPLQQFLRLIQGGRRSAGRASADTNDDLIANLKQMSVITRCMPVPECVQQGTSPLAFEVAKPNSMRWLPACCTFQATRSCPMQIDCNVCVGTPLSTVADLLSSPARHKVGCFCADLRESNAFSHVSCTTLKFQRVIDCGN